MTTFVPITRFSRCKRYAGALIQCPNCNNIGRVYHLSWSALTCPNCNNIGRVYHLSWSALTCPNCKKSVDKFEWLIEKGKYSKEVNK